MISVMGIEVLYTNMVISKKGTLYQTLRILPSGGNSKVLVSIVEATLATGHCINIATLVLVLIIILFFEFSKLCFGFGLGPCRTVLWRVVHSGGRLWGGRLGCSHAIRVQRPHVRTGDQFKLFFIFNFKVKNKKKIISAF